jgi:hypothetical protein
MRIEEYTLHDDSERNQDDGTMILMRIVVTLPTKSQLWHGWRNKSPTLE